MIYKILELLYKLDRKAFDLWVEENTYPDDFYKFGGVKNETKENQR